MSESEVDADWWAAIEGDAEARARILRLRGLAPAPSEPKRRTCHITVDNDHPCHVCGAPFAAPAPSESGR